MARRPTIAAGVLVAGICQWWGLRFWVPSAVERFYLVLPPVVATLSLLASDNPRRWLRTQGLLILAYLVFILLGSLASGYYNYGPGGGGASWSMAWSHTREMLLAGYFVLALASLLFPLYSLLRHGVGRLEKMWRGPFPKEAPLPVGRDIFRRYVPLLLLAPLAVPYLLGVSFIHRVKIPNVDPVPAMNGRPFATSQGPSGGFMVK